MGYRILGFLLVLEFLVVKKGGSNSNLCVVNSGFIEVLHARV